MSIFAIQSQAPPPAVGQLSHNGHEESSRAWQMHQPGACMRDRFDALGWPVGNHVRLHDKPPTCLESQIWAIYFDFDQSRRGGADPTRSTTTRTTHRLEQNYAFYCFRQPTDGSAASDEPDVVRRWVCVQQKLAPPGAPCPLFQGADACLTIGSGVANRPRRLPCRRAVVGGGSGMPAKSQLDCGSGSRRQQ